MIVIIIAVALNFVKTPYFVEKPGAAESINGLVKVKGGHKVNGKFMLVYIYVGQANVYQYLWAKYDRNKYTTLVKEEEIKLPNENEEEYNLRQLDYMKGAQTAATYVAYKKAEKQPKLEKKGILILDVVSSMPGAKVLRSGDIIIGAEGKKVQSIDQMQPLLKGKKPGDVFHVTVKRAGKVKQVSVTIGKFPKNLTGGKTKYGIGITQSNQASVAARPPLSFNIKNIGGPSAGLMMTLEIYDQLTKQDLAKGRKIAGTGTMEIDGSVGPIGGIDEKVVGANASGADVFFAPTADHEAENAKKTAKAIGAHLKIVPVRTFDDAVGYLKRTK